MRRLHAGCNSLSTNFDRKKRLKLAACLSQGAVSLSIACNVVLFSPFLVGFCIVILLYFGRIFCVTSW